MYPNLAGRLKLTGINQLWVADITYVRLRETFVYLAIVMDAYSRRVVGWELGEDLRAELALGALDRALADRAIEPGIVHHSDRGVQYCCHAYVEKLQAHGFVISMSRTGNPYDNAKAESFMKTLKSEEVYLHQYRDQEEARASIQRFIEEVYNRKRLHSALGYLSPDVFEQQHRPPPAWPEERANEFSKAWGNLSVRWGFKTMKAGAGVPPPVGRPRSPAKGRDGRRAPCSSSAMSFQLAIPWRVALQQSPPPLHQPPSVCAGASALAIDCQRMVTCP